MDVTLVVVIAVKCVFFVIEGGKLQVLFIDVLNRSSQGHSRHLPDLRMNVQRACKAPCVGRPMHTFMKPSLCVKVL
jgi:hypothetical protein